MKKAAKKLMAVSAAAMMLLSASCGGTQNPPDETDAPGTEAEVITTEEKTEMIDTTAEATTQAGPSGQDKLAEIIRSAPEITAKAVVQFNIPVPEGGLTNPQGGYTDGVYWYQMFMKRDNDSNEQNNLCKMVKYDIAQKKIVKKSGDIKTNHSNDILYNANTDRLYVVHNNPNRKLITPVNPETLEPEPSIELPSLIYCMTYNPTHDRYVVGIAGGQDFMIMKPNFKGQKVCIATPLTKGYVTQGCTCDDNFIYFVLYNENCITVYDWDGNFTTRINFSVGKLEPENISVVDGTIYIGVASNGITVYKLKF